MAIRLDAKAEDAQGLPVVSWEEDRNLFAPGGATPARVSCFIRPDENGVLQFVSIGPVRHGETEEARPWEKLVRSRSRERTSFIMPRTNAPCSMCWRTRARAARDGCSQPTAGLSFWRTSRMNGEACRCISTAPPARRSRPPHCTIG